MHEGMRDLPKERILPVNGKLLVIDSNVTFFWFLHLNKKQKQNKKRKSDGSSNDRLLGSGFG
jgi:hypothetical protein